MGDITMTELMTHVYIRVRRPFAHDWLLFPKQQWISLTHASFSENFAHKIFLECLAFCKNEKM